MLNELKNFLFRGNILELAIAVIVAGAFGSLSLIHISEPTRPY